jgi:hypothetical protein
MSLVKSRLLRHCGSRIISLLHQGLVLFLTDQTRVNFSMSRLRSFGFEQVPGVGKSLYQRDPFVVCRIEVLALKNRACRAVSLQMR